MERNIRLRSNRDFRKIYKKGKAYFNKNFTFIVKKNNANNTRIGFSITKKYGNAVNRNSLKRRLREIFRQNYDQCSKNYDIVVIPKPNVKYLDYKQLENSIKHLIGVAFRTTKRIK